MPGLNLHMLIGRVGKDPEIRTFQDGNKIASFSIATSETWRDKQSGEKKERTNWHNVVVKNQHLIKLCEDYVHKGDMLNVIGAVETRKWTDQSGAEKYTTETVVGMFKGEINLLPNGQRERDSGGGRNAAGGAGQSASGPMTGADIDDDIPF